MIKWQAPTKGPARSDSPPRFHQRPMIQAGFEFAATKISPAASERASCEISKAIRMAKPAPVAGKIVRIEHWIGALNAGAAGSRCLAEATACHNGGKMIVLQFTGRESITYREKIIYYTKVRCAVKNIPGDSEVKLYLSKR